MIPTLTYVDKAMVCDLPAGLEPQHIQGPGLFGRKVGEGGVGHVISLQVELVQVGQQLGDGADALVSHVDAVLHSIQGSVHMSLSLSLPAQ